jgi:hypothetical protein
MDSVRKPWQSSWRGLRKGEGEGEQPARRGRSEECLPTRVWRTLAGYPECGGWVGLGVVLRYRLGLGGYRVG